MASIFCQKSFYFIQFIIHMIPFDRTSRTFDTVFCICQNEYWLIVFFTNLSSNNSGKTFMTIRKINNQYPIVINCRCFHLFDCLFNRNYCQVLSTVIQRFQIPCQNIGFFLILSTEQCQSTFCTIQSSAGIQTRSKYKTNMVRSNCRLFNSCTFN